MEDFKKNWNNYETSAIRQFDLIMADILDVLDKKPVSEARQYIRGLRDGNRFSRKRPEIKLLDSDTEQ